MAVGDNGRGSTVLMSRTFSRDSTKPNTGATTRRANLTSAEKHRHDRLK